MAYPQDKETWRRVVGRDFPASETGDEVEDDDHNLPVDFMERLEDILGYDFIDGFSDLADRLDTLIASEDASLWAMLGGIE